MLLPLIVESFPRYFSEVKHICLPWRSVVVQTSNKIHLVLVGVWAFWIEKKPIMSWSCKATININFCFRMSIEWICDLWPNDSVEARKKWICGKVARYLRAMSRSQHLIGVSMLVRAQVKPWITKQSGLHTGHAGRIASISYVLSLKRAEREQQSILRWMSYRCEIDVRLMFNTHYLACVSFSRQRMFRTMAKQYRTHVNAKARWNFSIRWHTDWPHEITSGQQTIYSSHVSIDIWGRWWKCNFTLALLHFNHSILRTRRTKIDHHERFRLTITPTPHHFDANQNIRQVSMTNIFCERFYFIMHVLNIRPNAHHAEAIPLFCIENTKLTLIVGWKIEKCQAKIVFCCH